MNNYERIRVCLDVLRDVLELFVAERLTVCFGADAHQSRYALPEGRDGHGNIDVQVLVNTMINNWADAFDDHLAPDTRHLVHQVRRTRNRFAHQEKFDDSDTYTALHEIQRLIEAIGSDRAGEIEQLKAALVKSMALGDKGAETVARLESVADSAISLGAIVSHAASLVMFVSGRESQTRFGLDLPVTIGRSETADEGFAVDLSEIEGSSYVSRKHARITREPDGYWLEDLGSSNGTYVLREDFERIERVQIVNGDQIAFGNARFLFIVEVSD